MAILTASGCSEQHLPKENLMSYPCYGRYAVAEPPSNLELPEFFTTRASRSNWLITSQKVGVLDQSDLLAQGDSVLAVHSGRTGDGTLGFTANATTVVLVVLLISQRSRNSCRNRPILEKSAACTTGRKGRHRLLSR